MTSNRYCAPTARTLDEGHDPIGARLAGVLVVVALVVLWWINFPRGLFLSWADSHFPWPGHVSRTLSWTSVIVYRLLLEGSVCLPAALLLALTLPSRAILLSALLAVEEVVRSAFDVLLASTLRLQIHELLILAIHAALLVGGAALFRAWRRRRGAAAAARLAQPAAAT